MTPQPIMHRTSKLTATYDELRTDLLDEINNVELRIIKPATEAKTYLQPLRKIMKKRGDKKVEFIAPIYTGSKLRRTAGL